MVSFVTKDHPFTIIAAIGRYYRNVQG